MIGSLDTFDLFDLFDSVGPERPKKLLDYVLLSIPSVLVSDLPLDEKCNRVTDAPEIDETTPGTFPFNRAASRFRRVRDAIEEKRSIARLRGRK